MLVSSRVSKQAVVTCIVKEGFPNYNESNIILELLMPVCIWEVWCRFYLRLQTQKHNARHKYFIVTLFIHF